MPRHALFPFESDDQDILIPNASRHYNAYFHAGFGPIAEGERLDVVDVDYASGILYGYKERAGDDGLCRVATHRVKFQCSAEVM